MQNQSTSARTAAKYGSKSSLLFRQAPILAILMLCAVWSGCNQKDWFPIKKEKTENKIVIVKTLVCDGLSFGLVGSGSCLFDYNNAKKGYLIQLFSGDKIVRSYYSLPENLDFNLGQMRYEYSQKDSTIMLPYK